MIPDTSDPAGSSFEICLEHFSDNSNSLLTGLFTSTLAQLSKQVGKVTQIKTVYSNPPIASYITLSKSKNLGLI